MTEYRFLGKTSKDFFVIKGINVFAEKWKGLGGCATVINPLDKKTYTFSKYSSSNVQFVAGKDRYGYWLFFTEK